LSNSLYAQRGVSAQKEEVHAAIENLDQGLFAKAFCKVYPDYISGDQDWVNIMHADGQAPKVFLLTCTGRKPAINLFGEELRRMPS
jgi:phosphoribosylformylglycinamidine cyclo-ligase